MTKEGNLGKWKMDLPDEGEERIIKRWRMTEKKIFKKDDDEEDNQRKWENGVWRKQDEGDERMIIKGGREDK